MLTAVDRIPARRYATRVFARLLASAAVFAITACAQPSEPAPVVLAAASMQGTLDEISGDWEKQGHARPVISYAGSQAIARQIASGAPADLILLADRDWMDHLEKGGHLTPGSRRELVSNTLVVVHPAAAAGGTGSVRDNMSIRQALSGGSVAMGEPDTVPAGRYARSALEALGLWRSTRRRIIPTESVRAALTLAERGEVDAAIVYRSDAAASGNVRVVARMPVTAHPPIRYQAAIVRGSTADERADFLAHLSSADATPVFSRRGFTLLPVDD